MGIGLYKVIRDPIHNLIGFCDSTTDRLLIDLINCREFQRLRRIKQLGFSEIVFPGANHSRLAHSIGVMHTARAFLDRIQLLLDGKLTDELKLTVLVAALVHDVGHGPFSHAFEKVSEDSHELRTIEIILGDTEINKKLAAIDAELPERIARFFREDPEGANPTIPACLTHIVTSQLDADRSDYLLRDSYSTGTDYGHFDLKWIVDHLGLDEKHGWLYLGQKAFLAGEQYIFARYHMYQAVYFHKATRASEVMLRLLFNRYKILLKSAAGPSQKQQVVPSAPPAIVRAFSGRISLADYLQLDDHTVTEFLKQCEECGDQVLSRLASGILHRRLLKCVDLTNYPKEKMPAFHGRAKECVESAGFDASYFFEHDTPADTPYKFFDPTDDQPATQIFVEDRDGKIRPIDDLSEQVQALRKRITLFRYYFPAEVRSEIRKIVEN